MCDSENQPRNVRKFRYKEGLGGWKYTLRDQASNRIYLNHRLSSIVRVLVSHRIAFRETGYRDYSRPTHHHPAIEQHRMHPGPCQHRGSLGFLQRHRKGQARRRKSRFF